MGFIYEHVGCMGFIQGFIYEHVGCMGFIQGFIQRPLTCMGFIHGQVRQLRGYLASCVTSQLARHRNSNR
jgi:hypothetical protein